MRTFALWATRIKIVLGALGITTGLVMATENPIWLMTVPAGLLLVLPPYLVNPITGEDL